MSWNVVLDCGHWPTIDSGISTGIAYDQSGKSLCYDCATLQQREEIKANDSFVAYLASDGNSIITWNGDILGRVTYNASSRNGFYNSKIHYVNAFCEGRHFYGKNGGNGMAIRLKANKVN